ncbi:uncharacterized protein STEHIDRAFT_149102 [Stereum hirsutum FP-91666 SS1]|uniref:uncharacterized protein n=1 Tax=Stereum hirsutum (strain FP-91666) TaxID=721885 RepID=UPI000444957F|nr:uncharacterized protein STEHIDRAFT_149102 [Stereum hirsutum FP-91666 SS1]EIM82633.1 hypothetical protein STEHIDRAFT_149102 [Stereum hirsutum FP-91666 SS1]
MMSSAMSRSTVTPSTASKSKSAWRSARTANHIPSSQPRSSTSFWSPSASPRTPMPTKYTPVPAPKKSSAPLPVQHTLRRSDTKSSLTVGGTAKGRPRGASVSTTGRVGRGRGAGVHVGHSTAGERIRVESSPDPSAFEEWMKAYASTDMSDGFGTGKGFGTDTLADAGEKQTHILFGAMGQTVVRTVEEREREAQKRVEVRKMIAERRKMAEERRREERRKIEEKRKSDETLRRTMLRTMKDGPKAKVGVEPKKDQGKEERLGRIGDGVPLTPFTEFQWPIGGPHIASTKIDGSAGVGFTGSMKPLPGVPRKEKIRSVLQRLQPERFRESAGKIEEVGGRTIEERAGSFVRYLNGMLHRVMV